MRLIDADEIYYNTLLNTGNKEHPLEWAVSHSQIDKMPTIEERRKGKWIIDKGLYKCSSCGELWLHWWAVIVPTERMYKMMRFCPNCGADMRGKQNE